MLLLLAMMMTTVAMASGGVTNYEKDPFSMTMSVLLFVFSSLLVLILSYFTGYSIGKFYRINNKVS